MCLDILPTSVSVHHLCALYQKRALDPLELKLQIVVSHYMGGGDQTLFSGKASSALNHQAISIVLPWKYFSILLINYSIFHSHEFCTYSVTNYWKH